MPLVSIVVPTLREAANLPILVERIATSLAGREFEILIVDDNSRDGTDRVCEELAKTYPVRCIVRTEPVDGLGGAVLLGLREARGDIFVVMDADLQHPPERLPALLAPIENGSAEFVVGSRSVEGGSTSHDWPISRRLTSWVARTLASSFAGDLRDVMSGYFALPRAVFERGEHLAPLGFKIGLELICKCRVTKLVEIPIHFGVRSHGQSKLDTREKFRYLEHLSRLYDFRFPRLIPLTKFAIVVSISGMVGLGVYQLLTRLHSLYLWQCLTLSYVAVLLVTAIFHHRYVRAQKHWLVRPHPWMDFLCSAVAELFTCGVIAFYLDHRLRSPTAWELYLIPFASAIVVRYILRKELLLDVRGLRFMPPLPKRD
jgi:dolichol-phosphate mannosyltransferase